MRRLLAMLTMLFLISGQAWALTLTTEEYPPFSFSNDRGKTVTGFATDAMNEILKRAEIKATIGIYPWQRAYLMALNDKNTCVYSTTRTAERENLFKWVGPLVLDSWVLYARAESPIKAKSLADVKSYKIGGYKGDAKANFLKEQGLMVEESIYERQVVNNLTAGTIDLWATSSSTGPWIAKNLGLKIKPVLTVQDVHLYLACNIAIPDNDIAKMNEEIKSIKADGTLDRFIKTYQ